MNGQAATTSQWPSFAALRWQTGDRQYDYLCGGTFISAEWVLTAAHCFEDEMRRTTRGWRYAPLSDLSIVGGAADLGGTGPSNVHRIRSVVIHPDYRPSTETSGSANDIALVRLRDPWAGQVSRLSAGGQADSDATGGRAFVAGFGLQADPDEIAGISAFDSPAEGISAAAGSQFLLHVMLPMKPPEDCMKKYAKYQFDALSQICAGHFEGRRDSCSGDSGGPLAALDEKGRTYQVGIVSYGWRCAAEQREAVYTRIARYRDFIQLHVPDARFVEAKPEIALVASHEMMTALASAVPPARNDELSLTVGQMTSGSRRSLTVSVDLKVSGRLLILEQEAGGRINRLYPNGKTAEADYVLDAGRKIDLPGAGQIIPPSKGGGTVYAFVIPDAVTFAGDLLPTPERVRTVPLNQQAEAEPVTYAARLLSEIAARSTRGGLADWYAASSAYPDTAGSP
ncbi:serine protease [Hyphomonas sp. CACIAM 19H1]|uniref:S1 family serine peptidase n=1 Tax=Hyphomonas sp. CACIAM 19H1 TaxID=1873716 RepID=UPI0013B05102|nr:serine protease [Hyphomonas sp. CACIAM 19H1]